jgi:hypothetical protein
VGLEVTGSSPVIHPMGGRRLSVWSHWSVKPDSSERRWFNSNSAHYARRVINAKLLKGLFKRWIAGFRRHRGLLKFPGDAAGEGSCARQSDWIVSHTCHSR